MNTASSFYKRNQTDKVSKRAPYCQKCLKGGHWSYECTAKRKIVYRDSRTKKLTKMCNSLTEKANASNPTEWEHIIMPQKKIKNLDESSSDSESDSDSTSSSSTVTSSDSSSSDNDPHSSTYEDRSKLGKKKMSKYSSSDSSASSVDKERTKAKKKRSNNISS